MSRAASLIVIFGAIFADDAWMMGATVFEDFSTNPIVNGWCAYGNTNLFAWDADNERLDVTWDSSEPNSYYYRRFPECLTEDDDFSVEFDMALDEIAAGVTPGKPFAFELAMGFVNFEKATQPEFKRGTGVDATDIVEFDYFPDTGYGATVCPTAISDSGQFGVTFNFPLALPENELLHVVMAYTSSNKTLCLELTDADGALGHIKPVVLNAEFTGFNVDAFAVISYSDEGSDGSLSAAGHIDNIRLDAPGSILDIPAPVISGEFAEGSWRVEFDRVEGVEYRLLRSTNMLDWEPITQYSAGADSTQTLIDNAAPGVGAFYRVQCRRMEGQE